MDGQAQTKDSSTPHGSMTGDSNSNSMEEEEKGTGVSGQADRRQEKGNSTIRTTRRETGTRDAGGGRRHGQRCCGRQRARSSLSMKHLQTERSESSPRMRRPDERYRLPAVEVVRAVVDAAAGGPRRRPAIGAQLFNAVFGIRDSTARCRRLFGRLHLSSCGGDRVSLACLSYSS